MSVNTYLETIASRAVLTAQENLSISTSIGAIQRRLDSHFGSSIREHFRFGSSMRGTILPRAMDQMSDIDYMVVFNDAGFTPQTYLSRLRNFVEKYYSSSEIYQSTPTIRLELNHIRFELVPALHYYGDVYHIPNGPANWQTTNPTEFNKQLTDKNATELYKIKPTIRLAKYWNAEFGYVYQSYEFEKWIVNLSYYAIVSQRDYLFHVFDQMLPNTGIGWRDDRIRRARDLVVSTRNLELAGYGYSAEAEIKKLIPEI